MNHSPKCPATTGGTCTCGADKLNELSSISAPVVDFLYKYGCPHSMVVITQTSAELLHGDCCVPFESRD